MHLDDVRKHLERRAHERGLAFSLGGPTPAPDFAAAEIMYNIVLPQQVHQFYAHFSHLRVDTPPLEILAVRHFAIAAPQCLHFATVDTEHLLCFDFSHVNAAGQWDIVAMPNRNRVTFTMASFWSNKIWVWIDTRRPLWQPDS